MSRKRTALPAAIETEIERRTLRGESAETIAAVIGDAISVPTLRRRMAEIKGRPHASARSSAPPAVPSKPAGGTKKPADEVPDEVPDGTSSDQIDRWIKACEKGLARAEGAQNLAAVASLAAKASQLISLKHRMAPAPPPDPNANPDYQKFAELGEERLMSLARELFSEK